MSEAATGGTYPVHSTAIWSYVLRGVVALVFGLLMLLAPTTGLASFILALGIFTLADGIVALVAAFLGTRGRGFDWTLAAIGILGIVLGLLFLFRSRSRFSPRPGSPRSASPASSPPSVTGARSGANG
jgi:uncharacterized membrane protein HdeD (DUF308 family)